MSLKTYIRQIIMEEGFWFEIVKEKTKPLDPLGNSGVEYGVYGGEIEPTEENIRALETILRNLPLSMISEVKPKNEDMLRNLALLSEHGEDPRKFKELLKLKHEKFKGLYTEARKIVSGLPDKNKDMFGLETDVDKTFFTIRIMGAWKDRSPEELRRSSKYQKYFKNPFERVNWVIEYGPKACGTGTDQKLLEMGANTEKKRVELLRNPFFYDALPGEFTKTLALVNRKFPYLNEAKKKELALNPFLRRFANGDRKARDLYEEITNFRDYYKLTEETLIKIIEVAAKPPSSIPQPHLFGQFPRINNLIQKASQIKEYLGQKALEEVATSPFFLYALPSAIGAIIRSARWDEITPEDKKREEVLKTIKHGVGIYLEGIPRRFEGPIVEKERATMVDRNWSKKINRRLRI